MVKLVRFKKNVSFYQLSESLFIICYSLLANKLKRASVRAPDRLFHNWNRFLKGVLAKITYQPMRIIHKLTHLRLDLFQLKMWFSLPRGGVCGWAVNTSNSGSGGPGFKPRPSRSFLRQGILPLCLSSPRCINGYRRHTAGGSRNLIHKNALPESRAKIMQ